MQTANVMVHLGGDHGNQVPKTVTAAEIAVLIQIHGNDAVTDIEPIDPDSGTVRAEFDRAFPTTNREELARLHSIYGGARDGEGRSFVSVLFPGAGARVFETVDELGLPESLFKPTARAGSKPADPLDHDGDGKKGGSKAKKTAKNPRNADADPIPLEVNSDDGVADMPDAESEDLFK